VAPRDIDSPMRIKLSEEGRPYTIKPYRMPGCSSMRNWRTLTENSTSPKSHT